jgi:alpha-L-fucosidase
MIKLSFIFIFFFPIPSAAQQSLPKPTAAQFTWHQQEFYLFIHFGPNTFTDKEWGEGTEHEEIFNPTNLDCNQWCRIAKQAGAKGIIITAKHHDGFCLWPSNFSKHTVRESKWKNGEGDVLKELSAACKQSGLKFGVYISPWDRNHPYYGTERYNDIFVNMMTELFTNYGPIWELWWDGANGEGPNGKKQVYDWDRFKKKVKEVSPNTVVFSDVGPHIRWVGNEKGIAGKTNWNTLDTIGFTPGLGAPPTDTLNIGNINGKAWIAAECDVSIRPGWFYHAAEDDKVKTPKQLFDLYLKSVGRGANLLLNVPPDRRGLIHENDSASLIGFKKLINDNFGKNLALPARGFFIPHIGKRAAPRLTDRSINSFEKITVPDLQNIELDFRKPQKINCIVLKEFLKEGQRCKRFSLLLSNDKYQLVKDISGTTIGNKRIITFPAVEVSKISFYVKDQKAATAISEIEAYLIDEKLIEQ